ncbi:MAG: Gfo/Idh/MocA family oxidoreductase [Lentisphaeria bacterium]|jgi:predicted dehydrogenase|nr:Gfo/Idh/MocA family oxidoreductase [Lentisphaeria bacterium]
MIKAGVAGLGRWGQNLVRSVQDKSENISFTAGMVRHPDKVADFCTEQGLELFDNYDVMLADGDIDAVVLATPHSLHAEQMLAAITAGKHIYSEKPFTMHKEEAERVITAANDAGVQIVVGQNRRFHPAMTELRSRLADGALGTLLHVEAFESIPGGLLFPPGDWHLNRWEWPAAGMTPLGIHLIDGMVDLFGTVTSVYCQSVQKFIEADVDDISSVLLHFGSGMTGYICTIVVARPELRFAVHGTDASAVISARSYNTLDITPFKGEPETICYDDFDIEADALTAELEAFAEAVEGRKPYPIPHDQIIHVVAVLEAIVNSSETKAPVEVG